MSKNYGESLATALVWLCAASVAGVFIWMLSDIVRHGLAALSWTFLTSATADAGREGGIAPILVSTAMILGVCLAASIPVGLGAAVLLSELSSSNPLFSRLVRRSLDVLAGMPSIIFGLFGNALFCKTLGMGFSILSGGLTLACMVLPIFIRAAEEGLRSVPREYRLGAAALGLSRSGTLFRLLIPAAAPGLLVGLVLGVGRALAETAALIFTSGYVDRFPSSPFDSGRALSIHIYDLAMNVPGGNANAYGSTFVLVAVLFLLNLSAARLAAALSRRSSPI